MPYQSLKTVCPFQPYLSLGRSLERQAFRALQDCLIDKRTLSLSKKIFVFFQSENMPQSIVDANKYKQ